VKALIVAFHTLTIIRIKEVEADFSDSLVYFPVVGLFFGSVFLMIYFLWKRFLPDWNLGLSFVILLSEIILTGGLHIDGLSDFADSLGASKREEKLRIMEDPSIGVFGSCAVFLDLILRIIAISRILSDDITPIVAVPAISRCMMVDMCVSLPYAKKEGTGKAFVIGAQEKHRLYAFLICITICIFFGTKGIMLFFISVFANQLLKLFFKKEFKGITGDLLGSTNEIITMLLLFFLAI